MAYFKRALFNELKNWAKSKNQKPIILQGARQVGKTTLLKELGEKEFKNYAYFNFDENPELKQFFIETKSVDRILSNLSLVIGHQITEETLIIFDEIQECKEALNSLKYFAENAPNYKIAAAGSLLGITIGNHSSFPVGKVKFYTLYPLSFSEFLYCSNPNLHQYLQTFEFNSSIPEIFFNQLTDVLRKYFICGGLPEASNTMIETNSTDLVKSVLNDILRAYELDFSKHVVSKDIQKISYIWNSLPTQLARENKKFLYQTVKEGARAREYEDALTWLIQAGLVYKTPKISKVGVPMSAYDELSAFKLYAFDVGVLRQLAKLEPSVFLDGNNLFTEFKGALSENFILQGLIPLLETNPRYWSSDGRAEVDFVIQYKNKILPIEVKSDKNIKNKSLSSFALNNDTPIKIRYSLRNLKIEDDLVNIPLFLVDYTKRILDPILELKEG